MVRASVWLCVVFAACGIGCGGEPKAAQPSAPAQPKAEAAFATTPAAVPEDQPGKAQGMRAHLNLQNLVHLADVDQGGLFLDFGTPARMKYTIGHWKTGFGKDGADKGPEQDRAGGETTWTRVGATGRVYMPLAPGAARTLRFRLKPIGTKNMQLFVNGKQLPVVRLNEAHSFATYDVEVPADVIVAGENQVMLRFGGTSKLDGEDVAAELDYIRVLPSGAAPTAAAAAAPPTGAQQPAADTAVLPAYADLVQDVSIGSVKRRALALHAPATLSYYLEVPEQAQLSLRVGQSEGTGGVAKVRITPEGGDSVEVFNQPLKSEWQDRLVPLARFAHRVVRLDLVGEGSGVIGWSSPAVLVPDVAVQKREPAKSVIVLLIDTMRADKLRAFNPKTRVETPSLEKFAQEGTIFVNTQAPENWTKPSVASVLTGLYPATHGTKQSEAKLPDGVTMVSEVFKQAGFTTATFLANGYVSDKFGFNQGWDHYTNYIRENKSTTAENVFKEAGDWIEKHKDARFFVYIQTIDPHVPYDPPDEFLKKYDKEPYTGVVSPRKTADQLEQAKRNPPALTFTQRDRERLEALHDGEVSYHDMEFGKFVERLKQLGVYDQVLFVVTADHGEEFNDHGSFGHGHTVYQELLHVPFMLRRPGVVPAGKRIEETVGTVDVSPTVLGAAGVAIPPAMEGIDRNDHVQGRAPALPAVAFSDFLDDRRVIRAGRFKLILNGVNPTLFDLETDPGEKQALDAAQHPIAMRYCRVLLGQFLGARNLGDWLSAEQRPAGKKFDQETAPIDEKTRQGLKALGYAN
jgi:arylsulfatase A-like enzyme